MDLFSKPPGGAQTPLVTMTGAYSNASPALTSALNAAWQLLKKPPLVGGFGPFEDSELQELYSRHGEKMLEQYFSQGVSPVTVCHDAFHFAVLYSIWLEMTGDAGRFPYTEPLMDARDHPQGRRTCLEYNTFCQRRQGAAGADHVLGLAQKMTQLTVTGGHIVPSMPQAVVSYGTPSPFGFMQGSSSTHAVQHFCPPGFALVPISALGQPNHPVMGGGVNPSVGGAEAPTTGGNRNSAPSPGKSNVENTANGDRPEPLKTEPVAPGLESKTDAVDPLAGKAKDSKTGAAPVDPKVDSKTAPVGPGIGKGPSVSKTVITPGDSKTAPVGPGIGKGPSVSKTVITPGDSKTAPVGPRIGKGPSVSKTVTTPGDSKTAPVGPRIGKGPSVSKTVTTPVDPNVGNGSSMTGKGAAAADSKESWADMVEEEEEAAPQTSNGSYSAVVQKPALKQPGKNVFTGQLSQFFNKYKAPKPLVRRNFGDVTRYYDDMFDRVKNTPRKDEMFRIDVTDLEHFYSYFIGRDGGNWTKAVDEDGILRSCHSIQIWLEPHKGEKSGFVDSVSIYLGPAFVSKSKNNPSQSLIPMWHLEILADCYLCIRRNLVHRLAQTLTQTIAIASNPQTGLTYKDRILAAYPAEIQAVAKKQPGATSTALVKYDKRASATTAAPTSGYQRTPVDWVELQKLMAKYLRESYNHKPEPLPKEVVFETMEDKFIGLTQVHSESPAEILEGFYKTYQTCLTLAITTNQYEPDQHGGLILLYGDMGALYRRLEKRVPKTPGAAEPSLKEGDKIM